MIYYKILTGGFLFLFGELGANKTAMCAQDCQSCLDSLADYCGRCSMTNFNNMGSFCDPCKTQAPANLSQCLTNCQEILNDAQSDLNLCFTTCQQTITQCERSCLNVTVKQRHALKSGNRTKDKIQRPNVREQH